MDRNTEPDEDLTTVSEIRRKGRVHVRRARFACGMLAFAIPAHLEYLIWPYATSANALRGLLMLAYPLVLAGMVIAALIAGGVASQEVKATVERYTARRSAQ